MPLRLGIVGCGAVAEHYHLPAILESPEVRAVMFADAEIERARRFAERVPVARAVHDHRAMIEHVDVAVVTVPNRWHAPVAVDLLEAGVHVLVEKPMARTLAECESIRKAAADGNAVLAIGHDFRFFPVADAAHRLLTQQILGPIRSVDVRQSAGTRWPCLTPASLTRESGGGVLLSFGVHTLDLLLWWLGDLVPLHYADDSVGGVEAECECDLVRVADGVPVHVEVSRRRASRDTTIVTCDGGTLEIGLFEPAILRLTMAGARPLDAHVIDPEFERAPLKHVFLRQLNDLVSAVEERREPLVGGEAGARVLALVEGCYALRQPLRRPWDFPEAYRAVSVGAQQ